MSIQRGSDKHGRRLDEEQKHETQGLVQGAGRTRVEEWREPEPTVIYESAPPTVVYQQAPPTVLYQPAPPPAVVYEPAPPPVVVAPPPPAVVYQLAPVVTPSPSVDIVFPIRLGH